MKKYFIYTYGCQMNVHESEKLSGMLEKHGYTSTDVVEDSDIVLFNTCCIRKGAEDKIYGNLGYMKNLKEKNPNLIVGVCGCMSQQPGKEEEMKEKCPYIDIIFGTHNISRFSEFLVQFENEHKYIAEIVEGDGTVVEGVPISRKTEFNAYVNISYGCNNFCTYCIVPYVRGREKSRKPQDIVNEVEEILKQGKYKVITLLGQNVNSYGKDLEEDINFAKLLKMIADLPYDFLLKFLTSHPKDISDELIDVIASNDKISKALHLPVQAGSNDILKAMNRNYTAENYIEKINKIRAKIPNIALSSDIIVGFPGETDEDFEKTCDLVRKVKYNSLYVFMYSKRKGTVAYSMPNQVPLEVKRYRINKLLEIEKEIASENIKLMLGTTQKCLIEKHLEDNQYMVRTDCGKTVMVELDDVQLGDFVKVEIVGFVGKQLIGIQEN